MQHSPEEKIALLRGCAELSGLTDLERTVLLEMAEHLATGTIRDWGRNNWHLRDYVSKLFAKLRETVRVPEPAI